MKKVKIGQLVRWGNPKGKSVIGYVIDVKGNKYQAVFSDEVPLESSHDFLDMNSVFILDVYDVVVHEPKEELPTKPFKQLIAYKSIVTGKPVYGVFAKEEKNSCGTSRFYAHWANNPKGNLGWITKEYIISVEDIIINEPKEDKLTVAQEASNFGYQAIQGIISANEDKEGLKKDEPIWDVPQKKISFTFSDFDTSVKRTWKDQSFKDAVSNASLGLTGESGEVADLVKKAIYHGRGFNRMNGIIPMSHIAPKDSAVNVNDVKDELSDVLFYVSAMAQEFGFTLEEVARHNKEKLEKRYEKGFTVEESAQKKDKHVDRKSNHMGVIDRDKERLLRGGN